MISVEKENDKKVEIIAALKNDLDKCIKMNIRKGDIFFWRYTAETLEKMNHGNNGGTTYWCCSQKAIFDGDVLSDNFWGSGSNKLFGVDELDDLELTFMGNLDDYDTTREPVDRLMKYYDEADILSMAHSNSTNGQVYLKKGAKKNPEIMLKSIDSSIEATKREIEYLERKDKSDKEIRVKILECDPNQLDDIYLG